MPHVSQDAFLDHVGHLRSASFEAALQASDRVHGALFCDLDVELGQTEVKFSSRPGQIAGIDVTVQGAPRWVVLRLELGLASFLPGDVLGLVVRGVADKPVRIQPYMRMVRDGLLADTPFEDGIELSSEAGFATCLHTLSADDSACGAEGRFAIVLGLPLDTLRLTLEDLGFFVLPAATGLRSLPLVPVS